MQLSVPAVFIKIVNNTEDGMLVISFIERKKKKHTQKSKRWFIFLV